MDVDTREKVLEDLDSFVKSKKQILSSILDSVGWTEESLKNEGKVRCPVDPNHWIPQSVYARHKEICEMTQNGYSKEELEKQPPDSTFFYEKANNVIPVVVDQSMLMKILHEQNLISQDNAAFMDFPKTVDRWTIQFTPEQRLALYDYVVNASKTVEKPKNVTLEDLMIDFEKKEEQDDKPKSQLEILAEMRDYKRRRQSYRAKNVHITKKSYTEVMKEVIENQINYLVETTKSESSENVKNEREDYQSSKRKHSYVVDNDSEDSSSRSRDHDRRHSHSHHESSKHHSSKRKKHRKSRSRSRSPSHHKHKKSHKRRRSRD